MPSANESLRSGNFILDSLPPAEYEAILPALRHERLQQGQILVDIRQPITRVYFPTTAIICWLNSTVEGDVVKVGITGFEGIVGTPLLLNQAESPLQVEVQIAGEALHLDAETFEAALNQLPVLRQKVNDFAYQTLVQISQAALCNRFHAAEQRLCYWLLATQDRAKTVDLLLAREMLARMIGSTRPAASIVTATLQSAGLIRVTRGGVTILNRQEMEESACECYQILKQQFDHYLQQS